MVSSPALRTHPGKAGVELGVSEAGESGTPGIGQSAGKYWPWKGAR